MLTLAKWVMGGPFQALAAAAILALLPGFGWASAAIVALVALRKNVNDVAIPFAGAMLVAVLVHWTAGDITQVGTVCAALVASLVLAGTRSLAWSLLALGISSALYIVLVLNLAPAMISNLVDLFQPTFDDFVEQLKAANPEAQSVFEQMDVRHIVLEGMVWVTTAGAVAALLVARWLQARLYNPGGFRREFHSLRLMPAVAAVLALLLYLGQSYPPARLILPCVAIPMVMAGLALVHGVLGMKQNNGPLLVFFYVGLILTTWVGMMVLVAAAVMDSFVDFRNRIQKRYE
ncbi:hypothetical protein [Ketobacter sp.]|uniref:hypothetical protein n=1 Tax=Ketobacter sp. TaxID=2083498 RepID=UPI000F2CA519|nr:hypothetical protein [Ketobacter sp.]RLT92205.1 MAG: hypothetical protein D9N14_22090 [Ketobacter sp.]